MKFLNKKILITTPNHSLGRRGICTPPLKEGLGVVISLFLGLLSILFTTKSHAQNNSQNLKSEFVFGTVKSLSGEALVGATLTWAKIDSLNPAQGVITDLQGKYKLKKHEKQHFLVAQMVGYQNDTLCIMANADKKGFVNFSLKEITDETNGAVVVAQQKGLLTGTGTEFTQKITSTELKKAACCNLSESFETNAAVDVHSQDEGLGTKKIRFLGVDGSYAQISTENMPSVRGLASSTGLNFVPGTWIESISISKGAGSVVNGYEAMTGQINVELIKPCTEDRILANVYANQMNRFEGNLNLSQKISDKWSTVLLTHASQQKHAFDFNNDGFLDMPSFSQVNALSRFERSTSTHKGQYGIKFLSDKRQGGQHHTSHNNGVHVPYEVEMKINRSEFFMKNGFMFPKKPFRSIGTIFSGTYHDQTGFWGTSALGKYTGTQKNLYGNFIYQDIIGTTNHTYKVGASYVLDAYNEAFRDSSFRRTEHVLGIFGEYNYKYLEKFSLVAGARVDNHNLYGVFFSPRLHLKYVVWTDGTLRASAGSGFRVPNPISENTAYLMSARKIVVTDAIKAEQSWNYGLNFTQNFNFMAGEGEISAEFYQTRFQNQLIVDLENPRELRFSQLSNINNAVSFANAFMIETSIKPLKKLDIRVSYKYVDVQMPLGGVQQMRPYVSRDKVLATISYQTPKKRWQFDFTSKWNGAQRLPSTKTNPTDLQRPQFSPNFWVFNAQVSHFWKDFEFYVGGENLGNYTQENPIIDPTQPFGNNFDASVIYAPIFGTMIYSGIRWKLAK